MIPLLVGSVALAYHLDKLGITHNIKPADVDFIVRDSVHQTELYEHFRKVALNVHTISVVNSKKFNTSTRAIQLADMIAEITYPKDGTGGPTTTSELYRASEFWTDRHEFMGVECVVAPLDVLYTLKMSHRFLKNSPHFSKTMLHIRNMRHPKVGAKITSHEWLKRREQETYDYSHPNLNVSKSEFFNSNFDYVYDHDSIHEAVKLLDRPAYTFYMASEESEVNCSKDKFFAQERTVQLLGVLEETYVLALERSQVPTDFAVDPRVSFMIALEKVCTSITSGWFREFAWENYELIVKMYDEAYVDKFKHALAKGAIKPFKGA